MLETEQSKRLLKLLREARKNEPHEDVRLMPMLGGVAFVRKSDENRPLPTGTNPHQ